MKKSLTKIAILIKQILQTRKMKMLMKGNFIYIFNI